MIRGRYDGPPLCPEFFAAPAADVARRLLGTVIVSSVGDRVTAGRVVETEAYIGPHDPASHAAARIGRTRRNEAMFGPPGTAYVYRIYGVHWCLNAVTDREDYPAAVLIRALEPLVGTEVMAERRSRHVVGVAAGSAERGRGWAAAVERATSWTPTSRRTLHALRALASGPARLCQALGIDGELNGHALDRPPLLMVAGEEVPDRRVRTTGRIGVTRAQDWPLRFIVADSPYVSR